MTALPASNSGSSDSSFGRLNPSIALDFSWSFSRPDRVLKNVLGEDSQVVVEEEVPNLPENVSVDADLIRLQASMLQKTCPLATEVIFLASRGPGKMPVIVTNPGAIVGANKTMLN